MSKLGPVNPTEPIQDWEFVVVRTSGETVLFETPVPLASAKVPLPSADPDNSPSVPLVTETPPLKELAPASTKGLLPSLMIPPLPLTFPDKVIEPPEAATFFVKVRWTGSAISCAKAESLSTLRFDESPVSVMALPARTNAGDAGRNWID
jgi:hypothetical protein